jgi:hypothetical protein
MGGFCAKSTFDNKSGNKKLTIFFIKLCSFTEL